VAPTIQKGVKINEKEENFERRRKMRRRIGKRGRLLLRQKQKAYAKKNPEKLLGRKGENNTSPYKVVRD